MSNTPPRRVQRYTPSGGSQPTTPTPTPPPTPTSTPTPPSTTTKAKTNTNTNTNAKNKSASSSARPAPAPSPNEKQYKNTQASSGARTGSGGRRPPPPRYAPPRRDTFPIIMGAVVGALIVGLLFVVYLLVSRNNGPTLQSAVTANDSAAQSAASGSIASDQPTTAAMDRTVEPNTTPAGVQTMVAIRPATGLGTPIADEGNTHVEDGQPITYKVYPPASGTHYNNPTAAGFYDTTVPEGNFVHSLEHGYIVIYYKPDVPDATKQQLKDLMTQLPLGKYGKVKLVIVPYTNMSTPFAIAAWDRLLLLNQYSPDEIKTFYQQWVDKGPEDVP